MEHKRPVTISRFFGIIISMYYNDPNPPPHFYVHYEKQKAVIDIQTLSILRGKLTPRVHGLVIEWASQYQTYLFKNWELSLQNAPLEKIKPLE
jgi:hypothetical protein